MAANFIHDGHSIDYTPEADVSAGDVILLHTLGGPLIGIAKRDIAAGQLGALAVVGVFDMPKKAGEQILVGHSVYWDNLASAVTASDDITAPLGHALATAEAAGDTVRVRLQPSVSDAVVQVNMPL